MNVITNLLEWPVCVYACMCVTHKKKKQTISQTEHEWEYSIVSLGNKEVLWEKKKVEGMDEWMDGWNIGGWMGGWMDMVPFAIVSHLHECLSPPVPFLFSLSRAIIPAPALHTGRSAASCPSYYLPHYTSGRRCVAPIVAAVIRSDQNGAFQTMTMNFFWTSSLQKSAEDCNDIHNLAAAAPL